MKWLKKRWYISEATHTRTKGKTAPCCYHHISNCVSAHKVVFYSFASHCSVKLHWHWTTLYKTFPLCFGEAHPFFTEEPQHSSWQCSLGYPRLSTRGNLHIFEQSLAHREQTDLQGKAGREAIQRLNDRWGKKYLTPPTLLSSSYCLHSVLNRLLYFLNPWCLCHYILKVSVSQSKKSGKLIWSRQVAISLPQG